MATFEKTNVKGRGVGKTTGRRGKLMKPPPGEPWAWLTAELMVSPAWRLRSINAARLIDFLLVEHLNHAGTENGTLMATYDQLVDFGLTRSEIKNAIREAGFLGLIKVTHEGGRYAGSNQPSTYRLTFYADKDGAPATNEWKGKTAEAVETWKQDQAVGKKKQKTRRKKQNPSATSRTTVVRLPELRDGKRNGAP